jgi:diadenosine tetraphosphatase ApaH/serine/threonine PP2A family protein phosphatase
MGACAPIRVAFTSGSIVMLIAILSDIHGNREALDACLEQAYRDGAEQFVFLGDLVGYGADPSYVVDTAAHFREEGALIIKGNHDTAVTENGQSMNAYARAALEWTRGQLNPTQKAFLDELPLEVELGEALFVHAEAANPKSWGYVTNPLEAERSMLATKKRLTFCGHVHRPQLYHKAPQRHPVCFIPTSGLAIPLAKSLQWQAVIGSVGQPRDEIPSAAYALYNDSKATLAFMRVSYDIERAAKKIKDAGLPAILAARLYIGR